jgi:Zn-dependent M28 family amino/carboxypeptidase
MRPRPTSGTPRRTLQSPLYPPAYLPAYLPRYLPLAGLLAACAGPAPKGARGAGADSGAPEASEPTRSTLPEVMDIDRLLAHLDALDALSAASARSRVLGSAAFDQSADYVQGALEGAGYSVQRVPFTHGVWSETGPGVLAVGGLSDLAAGVDYQNFGRSPPGRATGQLLPVDIQLPPPGGTNSTDSGCQARDWDDFEPGALALLQRGGCSFSEKLAMAEAAGAAGVILFNEGQADRRGLVEGQLDDVLAHSVPVLDATTAVAEALLERMAVGPLTVTIEAQVAVERFPTVNLLADLPGQTADLVVVGAHLDSVAAGPGINDNGSGTATVLELALQAAALRAAGEPDPRDTLRFAFWGAEEEGLIGSFAYVRGLDELALAAHVANLNFDMLASPNGLRAVYDGDGDARLGGAEAPAGSAVLEALFTDHFEARDLDWSPTAFDGRSDYGPFILAGVPAGGLFSGAEVDKSAHEALIYGGAAGEPLDACYHRACDGVENIDPVLLLEMAEAAAAATAGAADLAPFAADRARSAPPRHHDLPYVGGCDGARPAR